jgi:hypothetical protein
MEKLETEAKSCQICRFVRFLPRQQDNANTEALRFSLRQKDTLLLLSVESLFVRSLARLAGTNTLLSAERLLHSPSQLTATLQLIVDKPIKICTYYQPG